MSNFERVVFIFIMISNAVSADYMYHQENIITYVVAFGNIVSVVFILYILTKKQDQ